MPFGRVITQRPACANTATLVARVPANANVLNWCEWSPSLGLFCAVGQDNAVAQQQIQTSPDGINWTARASPNRAVFSCVVWGNGLFVAVASSAVVGAPGRVLTSPDGINWTERNASNNTYSWQRVAFSPTLNIFVAAASNAVGDNIMTSPDGINWTARVNPIAASARGVAWSPMLGMFAMTAGTVNVLTSLDGINWTSRAVPGVGVSTRFDMAWSADVQAFAAVGENFAGNTRALTSGDGINWTQRNLGAANPWVCVRPLDGAGIFLTVNNGGVADSIASSSNAIDWPANNVAVGPTFRGIAWNRTAMRAVLVGQNQASTMDF